MLVGANSVPGVDAKLFRIAETLPPEVLKMIHALPPDESIPVITAQDLPNFDGFIFGFPTRFGSLPSQVKALIDATGGLWASGALAGKGFGMFTSVGSQGGGTETTIFTSLPPFVHHGMIFIPPGYTYGPDLSLYDQVRGGSAWGAGVIAGGDGSRKPSERELDIAEYQGKYVAEKILKLAS